jgi:hypothetical protein
MLQKKLYGMMALLICLVQLNLSAEIPFLGDCCSWDELFCDVGGLNYIGLDTGYRYDKVANRAVAYGADRPVFASTQEQNSVNSYILGVKGRYECHRIIFKGFYHYGWIGDGHYSEAGLRGCISGHVQDGSLAIGYALPSNCCWLTAFYAGWSYDGLRSKVRHTHGCRDSFHPNFGKTDIKTSICGPWVGSDVIFTPCTNFELTLAEELHWGRWSGENRYRDRHPRFEYGPIDGYSNSRSLHNMWGNVFRIEGLYKMCNCWEVGLNLDYTVWASSGHGRFNGREGEGDLALHHRKIIDVKWTSFSATATIAYAF